MPFMPVQGFAAISGSFPNTQYSGNYNMRRNAVNTSITTTTSTQDQNIKSHMGKVINPSFNPMYPNQPSNKNFPPYLYFNVKK